MRAKNKIKREEEMKVAREKRHKEKARIRLRIVEGQHACMLVQ